jgi:signal peptidase II
MHIILIGGSLVVIGALAWLLVAGQSGTLACAGIALLLGGATGNVTDRILYGGVTDFFEVWLRSYRWPAFNVADSAITIGVILLIVDLLFFSAKSGKEK